MRTNPSLWDAVVKEVTAGDKGGRPGQWSARKAQLAVLEYKKRGGGYIGGKDPQNSLVQWTKQEWTTKSGMPSLVTAERYLPKKAISALSDAEYRKTSLAKKRGMKAGKQFVPQPELIAEKVRPFREV